MNEPTSSSLPQIRLALPMIGVSVFLTCVGLAGGWYAARQSMTAPDESDSAAAAGMSFDPTTLKNLGVRVESVNPTSHTVYERIPAQVVETPFTSQPVYAPIGGRVESVSVVLGQTVAPGQPVLVLIRDAIERPDLTMTSAVLQPASEELHNQVASLREAKQEINILETELDRLGEHAEAVPRKVVIDLRYDLGRANNRFDRSRTELEKHGFTAEQVEQVAAGGSLPHLDARSWRQALEKNGLWPESASRLFAALPEGIRNRLWTVSSIGELAARGLDSDDLIEWLSVDSVAGGRFTDIAALVQRGHTVEDVRRLHALGALDPVVTLRAPARTEGAWDVHSIEAKVGSRVEAGTALVTLLDSRTLYLVTEPSGAEKRRLLAAVQSKAPCRATPLISGTGPDLEGLEIRSVTGARRGDTVATLVLDNTVVATRSVGTAEFRTWALRPGLHYDLRIPAAVHENVYVVPSDAIAENGPERVVFVPDGDSFRSIPVEIDYSDHEVAVIAINKNTQLFPGDRVVVAGAFAIGIALGSGDAVDPHAGHNH